MTKKVIGKLIDKASCYGNIDNLLTYLQLLRNGTSNELEYSIETYEEYGSEQTNFSIYEYVEETDEEYEHRLLQEKSAQEKRELRERQEFERLQAKYGSKQ